MNFYLLVLVLSFHAVFPCEVSWDCEKCTKKKCIYVITKTRQYCEEPDVTESITESESLVEKDYLCPKTGKGIHFKLQQIRN